MKKLIGFEYLSAITAISEIFQKSHPSTDLILTRLMKTSDGPQFYHLFPIKIVDKLKSTEEFDHFIDEIKLLEESVAKDGGIIYRVNKIENRSIYSRYKKGDLPIEEEKAEYFYKGKPIDIVITPICLHKDPIYLFNQETMQVKKLPNYNIYFSTFDNVKIFIFYTMKKHKKMKLSPTMASVQSDAQAIHKKYKSNYNRAVYASIFGVGVVLPNLLYYPVALLFSAILISLVCFLFLYWIPNTTLQRIIPDITCLKDLFIPKYRKYLHQEIEYMKNSENPVFVHQYRGEMRLMAIELGYEDDLKSENDD